MVSNSDTSGLDLPRIRRSWVRFPPRSKYFFFTSCASLISFTRANAQWVIHGFISTLIYTSELILCFTKTIDLSTRLGGINTEFVGFIPQSLVLRSFV